VQRSRLQSRHAHADSEFAERAELEAFAGDVARLLTAFAANEPTTAPPN
jgi:hypothetical protein